MKRILQQMAGLAHEINNPVGYVCSNLETLDDYMAQLMHLLASYRQAEASAFAPEVAARLRAERERIDLDFLRDDIPLLLAASREGIVRVRQIAQDLRDFSQSGAAQRWQWADLHQGIDATLSIVANDIRYRTEVVKEYGDLPPVQCLPSQINQVVMNLVINALHAIGERHGRITLRTGSAGERAWLSVSDTGSGIAPEILPRIFDPFYTTKAQGQGTGLGLALAQGIVQRHGGRIEVESQPGRGATFRVELPMRQDGVPLQEAS